MQNQRIMMKQQEKEQMILSSKKSPRNIYGEYLQKSRVSIQALQAKQQPLAGESGSAEKILMKNIQEIQKTIDRNQPPSYHQVQLKLGIPQQRDIVQNRLIQKIDLQPIKQVIGDNQHQIKNKAEIRTQSQIVISSDQNSLDQAPISGSVRLSNPRSPGNLINIQEQQTENLDVKRSQGVAEQEHMAEVQRDPHRQMATPLPHHYLNTMSHNIFDQSSTPRGGESMLQQQERLPMMDGVKVEQLAIMDYAMGRINSRFKVDLLNKCGLSKTDYDALQDSQASLSPRAFQQSDRDGSNIGSQNYNLMFGLVKNPRAQKEKDSSPLDPQSLKKMLQNMNSGNSLTQINRPVAQTDRQRSNEKNQKSSQVQKIENGETSFKTIPVDVKQKSGEGDVQEQTTIQLSSKDLSYMPADLGDEVQKAKEQEKKVRMSRRLSAFQACSFIDQMIQDKATNEMESKRKFKDPDLFKDRDEEMEKLIGNDHLPSALERQRLRELKIYRQKIEILSQQIEQIKEKGSKKEYDQERAVDLFQMLCNKEIDPDVKKTTDTLNQNTAAFLGQVINDVYNTSERNQELKKLQDEMSKMVLQQMQYDLQIRHEIDQKRKKMQMKVLNAIMSKKKTVKSMKITPAIKKLQLAVNKNTAVPKPAPLPIKKGGLDLTKMLFGGGMIQRKPKPKVRNRLQKLIKKHFFNKPKNKLDIIYITKLAHLTEQLDKIFGEGGNIGIKYNKIRLNLWANLYLREVRSKLLDSGVKFEINYEKVNKGLIGQEMLFHDDVHKHQFYHQCKHFVRLDESETCKEKIACQKYFQTCIKKMEAPMPTFVRLNGHCLFLTECRITDTTCQAMADFLDATKDDCQKQIKQLIIDDCGMSDDQFSQILKGIANQGSHINQITYSNNELGPKSMQELEHLIPHLREIYLNNVNKCLGRSNFNPLIESCLERGLQLQKLKLSNVNLNDENIIKNLCFLIEGRQFLLSLDLSWTCLAPKHLNQIILCFAEKYEHSLRNLNLSYNYLLQPPKDENAYYDENDVNYEASEDFVDNLCALIQKNEALCHLDISGMNFSDEQIIQVSQTANQSESLMAIHMSDNGIRLESELFGEVLDIFGLSEDIFRDIQYKLNNPISNPKELRNILKNHSKNLNFYECLKQSKVIDANVYKKHLVQSKQGKKVAMNKMINQAQVSTGIGRTETSMLDDFVLQRQINQPELIFNQCRYKDLYFEEDSSEQWHLQDQACGMYGGCPVCRKHKYTLIFYQQEQSEIAISENEGLVEIKEAEVIQQIKDEFNLLPQEEQDVAPFICGTVVNGNFSRKLRMLRADIFCMLTICQSSYFVSDFKQINKIKNGIVANINKSQDLNGRDESIEYLKGWHRKLLIDKCFNNETNDMALINIPQFVDHTEQLKLKMQMSQEPESPVKHPDGSDIDEDCKTFVYGAYLPPGLHQFIIYCPKTKRAFIKDVVIDVNACDAWPEFPDPLRPTIDKPKKVTRSNVWRKWREDSEQDIQMAFLADCSDSFEPELFIKNAEDVEECKRILHENFQQIQIAYLEGLANSPHTYPEISFECFISKMLEQQTSEQEKKRVSRAYMELAFIRATRGDDAVGIQGTLCRGEFLETLLRVCLVRHPRCMLADYLEDFLFIYIQGQYQRSQILPIRKEIRGSKKLNQLLYDNKDGLNQLYNEFRQDRKGFTMESARQLLNPLNPNKGEPLIPNMREQFVYSHQTNLQDLQECNKYHQLEYVEFLEFICRVAKEYWRPLRELDPTNCPPVDIEDTVHALLEMMWERRMKQKPVVDKGKKKKQKKKVKEFPELIPCLQEDEDSD